MKSINKHLDHSNPKISVMTGLFVWSLLFEPSTYFLLNTYETIGIAGKLSRFLQFTFIFMFIFQAILRAKFKFQNPLSSLNINFTYYFIFISISGILGYFFGSYSLVAGESFRAPYVEYAIILYYFAYFVVFSRIFLVTKAGIDYFFKWFKITFIIVLIIGFTEFFLLWIQREFIYFEFNGLGRHIYENRTLGLRFHSIVGEPRDAYSYLTFAFCILALKDIWEEKRKLTFYWISLIILAALLTSSFSGLLGTFFAIGLLIFYYFPVLSSNQKLKLILGFLSILTLFYVYIQFAPRMALFYDGFKDLYDILDNGSLENGMEINNVMNEHRGNILPIWHLWLEVREFKFFHLFFGNGLGSANVVNSLYTPNEGPVKQIFNPNSGITRMLYGEGIIGIMLFISVFLSSIKKVFINYKIFTKLKLLTLIMIGAYFAHRMPTLFIFLGVSLAVLRVKSLEMNLNSKN